MKITPYPGKVQVLLEIPSAGGLDLSSKPTAVEFGEVIAVGSGVTTLKKGDKIFVKAWCMDCFERNKEKYYFVDADSEGICAIVQ